MSMIKCNECSKEISSDARICPHCGKKRAGVSGKVLLLCLGAIAVCLVMIQRENSHRAVVDTPRPIKPTATPQKEIWRYDQTTDQMTGKITRIACLDSGDQLQFGFPYNGGSTGTICLRRQQGLDAYFKISKGQILCGSDGCEATLRVDGEPPFKMSGSESDDADSRFMFFDSPSRILALARKAKEIKVETLYFEEGTRILTFEPSQPLDPKW